MTTSSNLADGWVAARIDADGIENSLGVDVVAREATAKVCGVAVARPQGHSWAPHPSIGSE